MRLERATQDGQLNPNASAVLARAQGDPTAAKDLALLQRRLDAADLSEAEAAALHHASFEALDRLNQRPEAFAHLIEAHRLQPKAAELEVLLARWADAAKTTITPLPPTKTCILPVFVTGLPGSGKAEAVKLLAQAAGGAPVQDGPLINEVISAALARLVHLRPLKVPREVLYQIAGLLRAGMAQRIKSAEVYIDATPAMIPHVGLICAALPEARVVHMSRGPVQSGWALLRQNPSNVGAWPVGDPASIAALQRADATLARHWQNLFPRQFLAFSGDALCRSSGHAAHTLLENVGLNWTAQCTQPKQHTIHSWHRYAAQLVDLRQAVQANRN